MNAARSIAFALAVIAAVTGCATSTPTAFPAASPTTTVIVPAGSTVAVVEPRPIPWCGGSFVVGGGTNFGSCLSGR